MVDPEINFVAYRFPAARLERVGTDSVFSGVVWVTVGHVTYAILGLGIRP